MGFDRAAVAAYLKELTRRPGSPEALAAAAAVKRALAQADPQDHRSAAAGVLLYPERFGLVELGRVEWSDNHTEFAATLVYADAAGQFFATTVCGAYAAIEEVFSLAEEGQLDPVTSCEELERYLSFAQRHYRRWPPNPGAGAEAEAVVRAARAARAALEDA